MKIERMRIDFPEMGNLMGKSIAKGEIVFGPQLEKLRNIFIQRGHDKFFSFTSNGFSAMLVALEALGVNGKKIIIPVPQTCLALINAIRASGNEVAYCDCNEHNPNLDRIELSKQLNTLGGEAGAVISPAYFGIYEPFGKGEIDVPVIEDLCQSILTYIKLSSAINSNIRVFSFYPSKNLIGIDGGCISINDEKLFNACEDLISYSHHQKDDGKKRYNFRLNDLSALMVLKSFEKLDEVIQRREYYWEKLCNSLIDSKKARFIKSSFDNSWIPYKVLVRFDDSKNRDGFIEEMNEKFEIDATIELFSPFENINLENFPNSKMWIENSCSVPFYETLTQSEMDYIINSLNKSSYL